MQDFAQQRIYCAEQIFVPEDLPSMMKNYSKSVIREQPQNIMQFSLEYFEKELKKELEEKRGKENHNVFEKPSEKSINKQV